MKSHFYVPVLLITFFAVYSLAIEQESTVKAAFVYRFCDYVEWPPHAFTDVESPIVLGVAGSKSQISQLQSAVAGRHTGKRGFEVREVKPGESLQGLHVFYLTDDAMNKIEDFTDIESALPILTITDTEKIPSFSVINFIIVNDRVRFEISQARAKALSLKLSSQLLSVAHKVYGSE